MLGFHGVFVFGGRDFGDAGESWSLGEWTSERANEVSYRGGEPDREVGAISGVEPLGCSTLVTTSPRASSLARSIAISPSHSIMTNPANLRGWR